MANVAKVAPINRKHNDQNLLQHKQEILRKIADYGRGSITKNDINENILNKFKNKKMAQSNIGRASKYNQDDINKQYESKNDDDENDNSTRLDELETKPNYDNDDNLSDVELLECYILKNLNTLASQRDFLDVGTIPRALANAVVALMHAQGTYDISYNSFIDKLKELCSTVTDNNTDNELPVFINDQKSVAQSEHQQVIRLQTSLDNEGFLVKQKNQMTFNEVNEKSLFFAGSNYTGCSLRIETDPRSGYYARQRRMLELRTYINFLKLINKDVINNSYNSIFRKKDTTDIDTDIDKYPTSKLLATLKEELKREEIDNSGDFRKAKLSDYKVEIHTSILSDREQKLELSKAVLKVLQHTPLYDILDENNQKLSENGKNMLKAAKTRALLDNMRKNKQDTRVIKLSEQTTMTITQTKLDNTPPAIFRKMIPQKKVSPTKTTKQNRDTILEKVNFLQRESKKNSTSLESKTPAAVNDFSVINYDDIPVNFRQKRIEIESKNEQECTVVTSYHSGYMHSKDAAIRAIKEINRQSTTDIYESTAEETKCQSATNPPPIICISYMNGGLAGNKLFGNERKKYKEHRDHIDNVSSNQKIFHLNLPTGRYTDMNLFASDVGGSETDLKHLLERFETDINDLTNNNQNKANKARHVLSWIQQMQKEPLTKMFGFTGERADRLNTLIYIMASILGYRVWTSCKSGKDRTTMEETTAEIGLGIFATLPIDELNKITTPSAFFNLINSNQQHKQNAQRIARVNNMSSITFQNTGVAGNINPNNGMWMLRGLGLRLKDVNPMK